jgi:hypothetical protein
MREVISDLEDLRLLQYDAFVGRFVPSVSTDHNAFIQGQVELLDPEDECAMIPQNSENLPLSDSVSYSRRLEFLASSL